MFDERKIMCRNMDWCSYFRNVYTDSIEGNVEVIYGSLIDVGHCPSEKICLQCKKDFAMLKVLTESSTNDVNVSTNHKSI